MKLFFWYVLMVALLWSVFYRSAIADRRTRLSIRLGLMGMAAASLVGVAAPVYGWSPDPVVVAIVSAVCYMQCTFARFWADHVPGQYIKPQYRIHRRKTDFADSDVAT